MRSEQDSPPVNAGGGKSVAAPHRYLIPAVVTAITAGVFVGSIFLMMSHLRQRLRAKVMQQDSLVLQAATLASSVEQDGGPNAHEDQLVNVLHASEANPDIFGVRLFDPSGRFVSAFPEGL